MQIIADTHVHLYDCYNIPQALRTLHDALGRLSGDALRVGLLTDRYDADSFAALDRIKGTGCTVDRISACARRVGFDDGGALLLVAGRQFVTAERIEVLSLCAELRLEDGAPAADVIQRVREAGGVPVLGWSPGKWLGRRGAVVRGLLEQAAPGKLLLGDTTLRPRGYPQPLLFRLARRRGLRVIAGTDALPCAGEEIHLGRYACLFEGDLDESAPEQGLRRLLLDRDPLALVGRRSGPLEVIARLRGYAARA